MKNRAVFCVIATSLCAFCGSSSHADLVTFAIEGVMDGGGPGFRYPTATDPNVKDIDSPFTLLLTYDNMQTDDGSGTYSFTSGVFTVHGGTDFSPDYVATLNSSFGTGKNITVTDGGTDIFSIDMTGDESTGTVMDPAFTGDEVFHDSDGTSSTSNAGAAGPNDRTFRLELEDDSGAPITGTSLPADLSTWAISDSEIRIIWRDSAKISLKGSITSITAVPEPSAFLFGSLVAACCSAAYWRARNRKKS